MDYILNGQASGSIASALLQNNMDVRALRPWVSCKRGRPDRSFIAVTDPVKNIEIAQPINNVGLLRREDWKLIDDAVVRAAQPRLRAVGDLRSRGLTFTIPNGMGKTVFETATQSDITPAAISMDGLRESDRDRPAYALTNLPLPIIHKDFHFSLRQLQASRNGGSPLDTSMVELASRKVADEAEKLLLGVSTVADQFAFGGGTIYGYTDFPDRTTRTITAPTASGWTGATFLADVLAMKTDSQDDNHFGPWILYVSNNWDLFLDDDFSTLKGDNTLRERVAKIEGIQEVRTLDFLLNFDVVLVQLTPDVVREVIGMELTTVQWETNGGMKVNFKVMAIMVPQLRSDFTAQSGIVHGSS